MYEYSLKICISPLKVSYSLHKIKAKGGGKVKGNPIIRIRIDAFALSEIKMLAESQGFTLSGFIREIIYAYLEMHS